jgi:alpha-1,6-mannosyltransferase
VSRIVQCANFVAPHSGGLRTVLRHLAEGYGAAGHEVVQIVPGPRARTTHTTWGHLVEVRAPQVPGTGYRVIADPWRLPALLDRWAPDRLEVHDRLTLRRLGRWAARRGVPSMVVSHERLDGVMAQWLPSVGGVRDRVPVAAAAARSNLRLASSFDAVVATTAWAAAEFAGLGPRPVTRIPLGVDLDTFAPGAHSPAVRAELADPADALVLASSRLSREKNPMLAVTTARALVARGLAVRLVVAGDGPLRGDLERAARGLPVEFLGFVADRSRLAQVLASADVLLAPGPIETFGLAALEALASGTPVVGNADSAVPEVIGPAGIAAEPIPAAFADAVQCLLARPEPLRRRVARARAEQFPWTRTVEGFLNAHRVARRSARAVA